MALITGNEKTLDRRRLDAFVRIAQNTVGTSLAAGIPTPALETAKMIGIASADAWMFWDIYKIYFDEQLSARKLRDMLGTAGVIVFTGGVFTYATLRISQSLINEFLNAVPLLGWMTAAALTGTSSVALGLAWVAFIENKFRVEHPELAQRQPKATPKRKQRVPVEAGQEAEAQMTDDAEAIMTDEPAHDQDTSDEQATLDAAIEAASTSIPDAEAEQAIDDAFASIAEYEDGFTHEGEFDAVTAGMPPVERDPLPEPDPAPVEASVTVEMMVTRHPEGREGSEIPRDIYDHIRQTILDVIDEREDISFQELIDIIEENTDLVLDKSVRWYVQTVKLDLEARGIIERIPGESPQRLRLMH